MAILPDVPAAALASYGGPKINYAPVEDAATDEDASNRNDYVEDVQGMAMVSIRAYVRFVGVSTNGAAGVPSSNAQGAVWGTSTGLTITRTGTGVYVITWPAVVQDALNKSHTISVRGADRPNIESSTLYGGSAVPTTANSVTVYIFNAAGTAADPVGVTVSVRVW